MAAVVRVKRRLEEEPLEAIILNCKRRKINDDNKDKEPTDTDLSATLLKFAGTIKEDENVLTHLKKQHIPEIHELKEHFKRHTVNISDKLRTQKQEISKSNRYKIVNCFRSQNLDENSLKDNAESGTSKSEYTILDVETDLIPLSKTDNQNEEICDAKYVYDLYYTNSDDFGDTEIEDYVSCSVVCIQKMCDIGESSSSSYESVASSDDEEYLNMLEERVTPKNDHYLEHIDDGEFIQHFRVSRQVANKIGDSFKNSDYFKYQSGSNDKISAIGQVLILLWFAGHQKSAFRDVEDRFNLLISSMYRIVRRLIYFLSNMAPEIAKWPNAKERQDIERNFREKQFPDVIGAIDESHVKVDNPQNDPDSYLNRKHFFSIQLQVVCNKKKIKEIFVGYPGSVHNSRVFRISPLSDTLAEKCRDYYILGDSGSCCILHNLAIDDDFTYEEVNLANAIPVVPYNEEEVKRDDLDGIRYRKFVPNVFIYPLSDPLLFGSTRDNGLNERDSEDDSEDSNAENNWRNDYPDESDMESINEDDMIEAVKKLNITEDLLSSDDGEEGFVYSIDSEAAGFEEDIDESDVFRYGERYARFKAKNKKAMESTGLDHDFYYGDIDENEYYY
ncbi:hypothetical protein NQ314_017244 [Rhamnusium bicolor]|uniref:Probable RNA polymerase II nuclear localization protein SLC7A6OS n=1 Tax=Rhamnusium bicolor TaxID=1586634 RepID=A0AAV8WUU2_9CUCU|nr:hypothetical protein NQ314_017244 [Rhamnusium bicolor]